MNSRVLHIFEKIYYFLLYILVGLFLLKLITSFILKVNLLGVINPIALSIVFLLIIVIISMTVKTNTWRKEGNRITKEAGLKKLTILPSNLLNRTNVLEFEIHHTPSGMKQGFKYRKMPEQAVKKQLYINLQNDFEKLNLWAQKIKTDTGMQVIFHTTTHETMAHIWMKQSSKVFYMKNIDKCLDKYAKMNFIQWFFASFATTGRIKMKKPKNWRSYYFFTNQGVEHEIYR